MTLMKEKLTEAIEAKNNDLKSFVWKFPRKNDRTQDEIRLVDATDAQLQSFANHCHSMLYNVDTVNPGRYELLKLIQDQRNKCNAELYLRKLESGELCGDGRPYPRRTYIQDIRAYMNNNKNLFPSKELKNISITACTNGLGREYERLSINDVLDAGLDMLGSFNNKHITFSFILNMGVYLTPDEMKDFDETDKDGNPRSKLELIKERLGINQAVMLSVKPTGLNYAELRAMINLKPKKYSELTTTQLTTLLNKVLFRLENEVQWHIDQWEERLMQIKKVADSRGIKLNYV